MCVIATKLTHCSQAFWKRLCVCVGGWEKMNLHMLLNLLVRKQLTEVSSLIACCRYFPYVAEVLQVLCLVCTVYRKVQCVNTQRHMLGYRCIYIERERQSKPNPLLPLIASIAFIFLSWASTVASKATKLSFLAVPPKISRSLFIFWFTIHSQRGFSFLRQILIYIYTHVLSLSG